MALTEYQWRPLDKARQEIRILNLNPGTRDALLSGRLRHVFLDGSDRPRYDTISYAWGETDLVDNISVAGQDIHIPVSAGSALRCMRSQDTTRTLWIDCVCINQNNEHEKTHQVSLMADIFQRSCMTLAHLGDDDDNTARRAFDGLLAIAKAWLESNDCKKESDNKLSKIVDLEIQNWSSLRETIDLVAIRAIMERPYFKRLWVVQEAVLSANTILCCNKWSIPLGLFAFSATWLQHNLRHEIQNPVQSLGASSFLAVLNMAMAPDKLSLNVILLSSIMLQCSDPRDRVFALLGLLRLSTQKCLFSMSLVPDYTKSVVDVYCDATRHCIGEGDELWMMDPFGYERSSDTAIEDLPTWVPNWYCGREQWLNFLEAEEFQRHAKLWSQEPRAAGTLLDPKASIGRVLSIRGVVLETISEHSNALIASSAPAYPEYIFGAFMLLSDDTDLDQRLDRLEHVLSVGHPYVELKRHWLQYLRLTAPPADIGTSDLQTQTTHSAARPGPHDPRCEEFASSVSGAQDAMEEVMRGFTKATRFCVGRKAFITQSGLLGIGPEALQDGDVIAVSKLSQMPMVLRRAEDSGPDHYAVIGPAFVENIHNGNGIFAAADEGGRIGTIHLV